MALVSIIISVAEFLYMSSHMGVKGYKVGNNNLNSTIFEAGPAFISILFISILLFYA